MDFIVEIDSTMPVGTIYFRSPSQKEIHEAYCLISDSCQKQLSQKYGNWAYAAERLNLELDCMRQTNSAFHFLVMQKVADLSRREKSILFCTNPGSILYFLLGISNINPLVPHYVCPVCRRVEAAGDAQDAFDIPSKKCPACGAGMRQDGHNCSEYVCWYRNQLERPYQTLDLAEPILGDIQPWLVQQFHDLFPHGGSNRNDRFCTIHLKHSRSCQLLNSLARTTGADLQSIDPFTDRMVRNMVADDILNEKQETGSENSQSNRTESLSFHEIIRLFGYCHGMDGNPKYADRLKSEAYHVLTDEIFSELLQTGISPENAAISANHKFLWSRADCLSSLQRKFYLAWFKIYYPTEFAETSRSIG